LVRCGSGLRLLGEIEERFQLLKVLPRSFPDRRKSSSGGRMTGDQIGPGVAFDHAPMTIANSHFLVQHGEARCAPEQHDDLGVEDVKLLQQVDSAVCNICRARLPASRAIFNRTGEVHGALIEADASNRAAEPLSGPSDKGSPRLRFHPAGCFTDEHDLRI
jgi:hypothetical protein